jgi:hypothetical protein
MPHKLHEWLRRIKAVEREYSAVRIATDRLLAAAERDPTILPRDQAVRVRDIRDASARLDGTYIIRLFAEFESGLRVFWSTRRKTETPGRTRDLLDGIAASQRIPNDQSLNAHAVREYRNALVHERDELKLPISIAEARSDLCRFFAFLPPEW